MMEAQQHIRSFVRNRGRLTNRQQYGIDSLFSIYGLSIDEKLDHSLAFENNNPVIMEIGFGMGHALMHQAKKYPEKNFIGVEVYEPGVGSLLADLEEQCIENVRVFWGDAYKVLNECVTENSINIVQVFFPDPWPKNRHKKRRLLRPEVINMVYRALKSGGELQFATDWKDYAEQALMLMEKQSGFENKFGKGKYSERNPDRPLTKFEKRGHSLGHEVFDLRFEVFK